MGLRIADYGILLATGFIILVPEYLKSATNPMITVILNKIHNPLSVIRNLTILGYQNSNVYA